jgi:altronate dehydratase
LTDKHIIKLINNLNRNPNFKDCIKVGISSNVELAHIWYNSEFSDRHVSYTYFLIKENNKYIGAVLDMTHDLHWVVLPKHRKKGYLTTA